MKFSLGSRWLLLTLTYWSATAADAIDGVFLGPPGNTCPSGSIKIMSKKKCSNIGKEHDDSIQWNKGIEKDENWPSGCYHCDEIDDCTDGTWFNKHPTGSSTGDATPWCMKTQPVPLLFVGDSDIAGWDTDIAAFPNSKNVGVGGWTCEQVLDNIVSFLKRHSPDTVVLVCGENDFGDGASVKRTFKKFRKLVREINAHDARVIYMGTKPEPDTADLQKTYRKYDKNIRNLARSSNTNLTMVDVYESFKDLGNNDILYATDGLHLSKEGYVLWTGWAKQALDTDDCVEWRSGSCVRN